MKPGQVWPIFLGAAIVVMILSVLCSEAEEDAFERRIVNLEQRVAELETQNVILARNLAALTTVIIPLVPEGDAPNMTGYMFPEVLS